MKETVCGLEIVVHQSADRRELERRVAQPHADSVIARVKKLGCPAQQKKELIDAICS